MQSHDNVESIISYATAGYALLSQIGWMQIAGIVLLVLRLVNEVWRLRDNIKREGKE